MRFFCLFALFVTIFALTSFSSYAQQKEWNTGFGGPKKNGSTTRYVPDRPPESHEGETIYCENIPFEPTVYVNFSFFPVEANYEKSIAELSNRTIQEMETAQGPDGQEKGYARHQTAMHKTFKATLGMTEGSTITSFSVKRLVKEINHNAGCVFIDNVHLDVEFHTNVYVAEELLSNQCKESFVLDHEQMHVDAIEKTAKKYEPLIREAVENYVTSYKPVRSRKDEYAEEAKKISEGIKKVVQNLVTQRGVELDKMSIAIDSSGEYTYGSLACTKLDFLKHFVPRSELAGED